MQSVTPEGMQSVTPVTIGELEALVRAIRSAEEHGQLEDARTLAQLLARLAN